MILENGSVIKITYHLFDFFEGVKWSACVLRTVTSIKLVLFSETVFAIIVAKQKRTLPVESNTYYATPSFARTPMRNVETHSPYCKSVHAQESLKIIPTTVPTTTVTTTTLPPYPKVGGFDFNFLILKKLIIVIYCLREQFCD